MASGWFTFLLLINKRMRDKKVFCFFVVVFFFFFCSITEKPLYTDTPYNDKIHYNDNLTVRGNK